MLPWLFQILYSDLCIWLHLLIGNYLSGTRTTLTKNMNCYQRDAYGWCKLPAVNSSTTTTVMTAHIAFFPTPLNNGSSIYRSETSVRAVPTLRAWMPLLWSSFPILHAYAPHEAGILLISFTFSVSICKLFLLLLECRVQAIGAAWSSRWMFRFLGWWQCKTSCTECQK